MKVLFTYLSSFKGHGGIEKFNKAFMYALCNKITKCDISIYSAYDDNPDQIYINQNSFKGFKGNKLNYFFNTVKTTLKHDVIVVGHINLASAVLLAKVLKPTLKVILITHGIDVWYELPFHKRQLLRLANTILAVSSFTKNKLISKHGLNSKKIQVFPNTLDPFFVFPQNFKKPSYLIERYNLTINQPILLSVCRLSANEGYKGYDTLIKALHHVKKTIPNFSYVIVGKYDQTEYDRVIALANSHGVLENIILTGYIPDEELTDHYLLGDLFAMPSREEGFGIVYIEAMACGLPVIAGNIDGSVDALDHGRLGTLVDPNNLDQIAKAVIYSLSTPWPIENKVILQKKVIDTFGFDKFSSKLKSVLEGN